MATGNEQGQQRRYTRSSHDEFVRFKVLFTEENELKSVDIGGRVINISPGGIGLITDYPLEPGYVLEWDDRHKKGELHLASVRWAQEFEGAYQAGAMII